MKATAGISAPVELQRLRFRKEGQGARLTVETASPVDFSLHQPSASKLVLRLEGVHIPLATNRLPLDTRFFGTAVQAVRPLEDSSKKRVNLHIELKGAAAYRVRQKGGAVVVDFIPPGSELAAGFRLAGDHP